MKGITRARAAGAAGRIAVGLGILLSGGAILRILEVPAFTIVSWSDGRLVEMAQERHELLSLALRRDPASPFRWCELGSSLLDQGRKEEAPRCFERALELGPNLVSNLSLAAQFYSRVDERQNVLRCSARILELSPGYKGSILESYTSSDYQLSDTLNYGLPPDPSIARDYFRVLLRGKEPEPIQQAWQWLAQRSIPDRILTNQYVGFLMEIKDYEQARETWISYLGNGRGTYLSSEFIYNGGFETEPCGSIFDWRISPVKGVEVIRDTGIAQSGKYSLRIEFNGKENPGYLGVGQELVLTPGKYRLSAYMRTEGISTDRGIFLRVMNLTSDEMKGSNEWTRVELNLVVLETKRVRVEVGRQKSEKFDCLIKGKAWVDAVEMVRGE
jgi:hypothetical protein